MKRISILALGLICVSLVQSCRHTRYGECGRPPLKEHRYYELDTVDKNAVPYQYQQTVDFISDKGDHVKLTCVKLDVGYDIDTLHDIQCSDDIYKHREYVDCMLTSNSPLLSSLVFRVYVASDNNHSKLTRVGVNSMTNDEFTWKLNDTTKYHFECLDSICVKGYDVPVKEGFVLYNKREGINYLRNTLSGVNWVKLP